MARARSPDRDKAYELWRDSDCDKKLTEIARELGVSDVMVRKWKSQDDWEAKIGNVTNNKGNVTKSERVRRQNKKRIMEKVVASVEENEDLTDKQRLFCIHYANSNNATQSYLKAYDCDYLTANTNGHKLLVKTSIKSEISRLKKIMRAEVDFNVLDLIHYCLRVVSADIGDYLSFGQREEPMIDSGGEPIMIKTNYVLLGESNKLDTSLISEVKQGKDGVSIKLADKKWAWEQLIKYFDLLPDKEKRDIDRARLGLERDKVQIMRDKNNGPELPPEPLILQAIYGRPVNDDENQ